MAEGEAPFCAPHSMNALRFEAQGIVLSAIVMRWQRLTRPAGFSSNDWRSFQRELDTCALSLVASGDLMARSRRLQPTDAMRVETSYKAWCGHVDQTWGLLALHKHLMVPADLSDPPAALLLRDILSNAPIHPRAPNHSPAVRPSR